MDRPICTQVETVWQRDSQAGKRTVRWSGGQARGPLRRPQDQRVLCGCSKKGLTAAYFPGTRGLYSAPPGVPEPGLALQLISVGPLMFPAGPGRPPRLSSELPKFTLYIQEGSVFFKSCRSLVCVCGGGRGGCTASVFPNLPLSSFFFPRGAQSQAWCSGQ